MSLSRLPITLGALGVFAVGALMPISSAQAQDTDSGWQPYLGCWTPDTDEQESEAKLCFVPDNGQVEMLTISDDQIEFREFFAADGRPKTIDGDGCRGTESARFSEDRKRIYTYSDLTCDDGARKSSGIISTMGPNYWLDVRAIQEDDGPVAWAQGYRRADSKVLTELGFEPPNPVARSTFRQRAVRGYDGLSVEDVVDATRAVDGQAVEAWLAERGERIEGLDAEGLIALEEAGVSDEVIDVVVAVSFPGRYALNRGEGDSEGYYGRRRGARQIYLNGYGYDPFYSRYGYSSFYGGGYGYGYGYGYPYIGGGYRPIRVIVEQAPRNSGGRVVNGQGYRRGGQSSTGSAGRRRSGGSSVSGSSGSTRSAPASRSGGRKAKRRGGR